MDAISFEFGPFRLEPGERRLLRHTTPIALPPKAFDLLVALVEHGDRLLRKEELMERLWPGTFVEEVNLAQNISAIRRVLGGSREEYIQTVAGAGYRFAAPVQRAITPREAAPPVDRADPKAGERTRLLVLPFRMLRPDADLDFLAYSLPDALSVALSAIDTLTVRSILVAARFASDAPDLQRIAREAHVDFVVSGTVLRAGSEVRVTAQLSDAVAGTLLWSHTSQAPVDNLFQLQDSLVERIIESLSRPLTEPEQRRLRHDVPASAKAYEFFLRANSASARLNAAAMHLAPAIRDLYLQSINEDARYAPAWARLARVYRLLGKYQEEDAAANLARADDALQQALALNPDLSAAHNLYAQMQVDRGHAQFAMVRLLDRLQQHGPNAEVFAGLVYACRFCGLLEESVAAARHAQRLDPTLGTSVMQTYFVMNRPADVVEASGEVRGYVWSLSLDALGRGSEALTLLAGHKWNLLAAARTLIEGKPEESLAAMQTAARTFADPEAFYYAARHYAHLGATRLALDALSKAIAGGYGCDTRLAADPWFDAIRREDEFQSLAQRAHEHRASAAAAFTASGGPRLLR